MREISKMDLDYPDLTNKTAENEIFDSIAFWILNNSETLSVSEAIAPMAGELFVPFKYNYPDILRSWLRIHSLAQEKEKNETMILCEKIIEITVLEENNSGRLHSETSEV
jgi:hypothetical protein